MINASSSSSAQAMLVGQGDDVNGDSRFSDGVHDCGT